MTAKRFWKFIPDTCNPYGVVIRIVDNETGNQHGTVDEYVDLLNELHEENQRLTDKLNQTALELVDEVISQGKAVEISEMSYHEFLDYRAKNGKPMELHL